MSMIPFSTIKTNELNLVLITARLGFVIGILFTCVVLYFSIYEIFFEVIRVTWSQENGQSAEKIIERGRGFMAFSGYWKAFATGLFIIFLNCLITTLVSLQSKLSKKL